MTAEILREKTASKEQNGSSGVADGISRENPLLLSTSTSMSTTAPA